MSLSWGLSRRTGSLASRLPRQTWALNGIPDAVLRLELRQPRPRLPERPREPGKAFGHRRLERCAVRAEQAMLGAQQLGREPGQFGRRRSLRTAAAKRLHLSQQRLEPEHQRLVSCGEAGRDLDHAATSAAMAAGRVEAERKIRWAMCRVLCASERRTRV
jgi:hypothetical protein